MAHSNLLKLRTDIVCYTHWSKLTMDCKTWVVLFVVVIIASTTIAQPILPVLVGAAGVGVAATGIGINASGCVRTTVG